MPGVIEGLLGLYNVRDAGAKGDGQTNDTPRIHDAILAQPAPGGTIVFPPGAYYLATNVSFLGRANITLWLTAGATFIGPGAPPASAGSNRVLDLSGGTSPPSGPAGGTLSGTYPNPAIAAPTVPTTQAFGDAAAAGASGTAADAAHRHGMPPAVILTGTLTARPASAILGRLYWATDQGQGGLLFFDTGTAWLLVGPPQQAGASLASGAALAATTWTNGPAVSLGAAGQTQTWLVWGAAEFVLGANAGAVEARITDGATIWSSGGTSGLGANSSASIPLPPAVVTPAAVTTYTLQGYCTVAAAQLYPTTGGTGQARATQVAALRIG